MKPLEVEGLPSYELKLTDRYTTPSGSVPRPMRKGKVQELPSCNLRRLRRAVTAARNADWYVEVDKLVNVGDQTTREPFDLASIFPS